MEKTISELKGQLKIEYIPITKLRPNEYNPKQMSEKEASDLEKSIVKFGIVDPLIVNKAKGREGIIVGGHQRYKIYQKLNFKEVPVVWLNIPDIKKEQELCLRLSKNVGKWDLDLLAGFDENLLQDIGWTGDELDEIFGLEMADEFDVEKEFEKVIKEPKRCKGGDIWKLGEHKLVIGDATKREDWKKVLGEERFDFLFTDPPYQLAYSKKKDKKSKNQRRLETQKTKSIFISRRDRQGGEIYNKRVWI